MAETIKTGQTVLIEDTDVHEYVFNAATNKTFKAQYNGEGRRTIRVTCVSGTIQYSVGSDDPDAEHTEYEAGDSFVTEIVNGVSNLKIKGTNPCSFAVEA